MNGNEMYNSMNINRLNNIIKNSKYDCLKGFCSYNSQLSNTTIYNYINNIILFLDYVDKSESELTIDDYTGYLYSIRSLTPSYQIGVYSALKKFSMYLFITNRNSSNCMMYVSRPKAKERQETIEKRENGYLTKTEIKKLLKNVSSGVGSSKAKNKQYDWKYRDELILMIFLSTGIRCSALYKIDVDNIDLKNKTLRITDKGSYVNEYVLSDELIQYIELWIEKRNKLVDSTEKALFISNQRTRLSTQAITKIVKKYSYNISGKNITPHKLRATFGTQIYNNTHDIYLTQKAMNHSNPQITELYIRGEASKSKKTASEIMNNTLFH